jgi:hypothetical protein
MQYDAGGGGSEERDPDFDEWYKSAGYKMFGGNRGQARQWYLQRKRASKPKVASNISDLLQKAMG